MRRIVLLTVTVAVVVSRYIDVADQDEKLMMMNDGVKSPYTVLDYNDYELLKNPAKLLPAIEQPKVYLTHPDRQVGDPEEEEEESIEGEDVEPKVDRVEAKLDCVPRKEAEEILTLGKGIQEQQAPAEENDAVGNQTLGREGDMIEEPMKLRIVKPLCDD
uniref:Secreted protein n=1 Tax=Steinernema glaseri TaxID=37863 RepID=A0A1I7ZXG0_9BILA